MKIAWPCAKRSALIFRNIFIHAWREKSRFWRNLCHPFAQRFTGGDPVWFFIKKLKLATMPNDNHTLAILWHAIIHRIDQTNLDDVIQSLQSFKNLFKIPAVAVKDASNIFKHPNLRLNLLHGGNENGKTISRIIQSHLVSTNTERLAWRTADNYVSLWKLCFSRQRDLLAITFEISPVSFTSISILFVTDCIKSLSLEPERKPAATSKQIQHADFSFWLGAQQRIDSFCKIHFLI